MCVIWLLRGELLRFAEGLGGRESENFSAPPSTIMYYLQIRMPPAWHLPTFSTFNLWRNEMNQIKLVVLTCFATLLAGCATPFPSPVMIANDGTPSGTPTVTVTDKAVSLEQDVGKLVFAEAVDSPRLTEALRASLIKKGFSLVKTRSEAEIVYVLDGAFHAVRNTGREAYMSIGNFAEKPDSLISRNWLNEIAVDKRRAKEPDAGFCWDRRFICILRYQQRSTVTITRTVAADEKTSTVVVFLPEEQFMYPFATIQLGLDTLMKTVGLPEKSILIKK
jgi:hypothetical protein